MMIDPSDAFKELATPGEWWTGAGPEERVEAVRAHCAGLDLEVVEAQANGSVVVRLTKDLAASVRGPLLLQLELMLKAAVDAGIEISLQPQGDINRLRLLRGITVRE